MPVDIASIRAKLSEDDLVFLREAYGIELQDPEVLWALHELNHAQAQLAEFEERVRKPRIGRANHCSFCDGSVPAVGALAQSPIGPLICHTCAVAAAVATDPTAHDA